jgi:hypothetical protein
MARRRQARKPRKKTWSFLADIPGDNNLSDAGLTDIRAMSTTGA